MKWEASEEIEKSLRRAVQGMSEKAQKETLFHVRRHNLNLEDLQLPIEVDPLEQLLEQPGHTFEQLPDLLAILKDEDRPRAMRTQAFRAALEVTGFTYGDWCSENLKALGAISHDKPLYETLGREFVQSSSHRVSMMQRVPKAYSKVRKLEPELQSLYFDVLCNLVQSPLTSEKNRGILVGGMRNQSMSPLFLDRIRRNRATAFLPLVKSAMKEKAIAEAAREVHEALQVDDEQMVGSLPVDEVAEAVLTMSGDPEEGKILFSRQSCNACHSVLPDEPQKGPYLGTAGSQFSREQLIQHIIDPGAEVAQGFQTYTFQMKDGTILTGFVTSREDGTIELRNIAGLSQKIQSQDVAQESIFEGSMMPPGLVNALSLGEFASLIDYLATLH